MPTFAMVSHGYVWAVAVGLFVLLLATFAGKHWNERLSLPMSVLAIAVSLLPLYVDRLYVHNEVKISYVSPTLTFDLATDVAVSNTGNRKFILTDLTPYLSVFDGEARGLTLENAIEAPSSIPAVIDPGDIKLVRLKLEEKALLEILKDEKLSEPGPSAGCALTQQPCRHGRIYLTAQGSTMEGYPIVENGGQIDFYFIPGHIFAYSRSTNPFSLTH